jgi:arylsulfatase A-like enzyme
MHDAFNVPAREDPRATDGPAAADADEARQRTLAYDAEIRFVDDQIARLAGHLDDSLGREHTLVIVATDHGEGLMQRGWMAHGVHLHEELVRAALIMRWPARLPAGRRVSAPVGLIDVAPTVLTLLGLGPMRAEAESLSAALRPDGTPPPDRALFFQRRPYARPEYRGWDVGDPMFAVRRGRWKYVETGGSGELFDLAADPGETRNVRDGHRGIAATLAAELRAWRDRVDGRRPTPQPISPEESARLRALGYVE